MSDDPKQKPPRVIKHRIHVPADLEPVYSNMVRIAHTPAEIVIDFSRMLPGDRMGKVVSRVVMSPLGAKLFAKALEENVTKYEASYGEINIPEKPSLADFLFKPQPNATEEGDASPDSEKPPSEDE